MYQSAETGLRIEITHRSGVRAEQNCWNLSRWERCIHGEMGRRSGTMGRRDQSPTASNRWADSKEPLPKCQNTDRHGEWRCAVEQYQKLPSDEIGRPRVDLQSPLASLPPMLPPVNARSMTPSMDNSPPIPPLPPLPRYETRLCSVPQPDCHWDSLASDR